MAAVSVRGARPGDAELVHGFVQELARYERLEHEVAATEANFHSALFGPEARVFCDIAELNGEPAGFAVWFYNFSTFLGRSGIYLEDLYVRPAARRKGAGRALLRGLARRCAAEGLGRLEWSVLDWNRPAWDFYAGLCAAPMDGWAVHRVSGEALLGLAAEREAA